MDTAAQASVDPGPRPEVTPTFPNNGQTAVAELAEAGELAVILASLQTVRDGNFSVRLPVAWTGLPARSPTPSTRSSLPMSRWRRS